jgi:hypothetical protein
MAETQPTNPTPDFHKWCQNCRNHETGAGQPCCENLGYIELSQGELDLMAETNDVYYYDDGMELMIFAREQGLHVHQRSKEYYSGKLIGPCGNKTDEGLCRLQEEGLEKPMACRVFVAGGEQCLKARARTQIIELDMIPVLSEP